jgi:hypothetical protein
MSRLPSLWISELPHLSRSAIYQRSRIATLDEALTAAAVHSWIETVPDPCQKMSVGCVSAPSRSRWGTVVLFH